MPVVLRTAALSLLILGLAFALPVRPAAAQAEQLRLLSEVSPPGNFIGPDGEPTGVAVEIVQAIQERIGTEIPIEFLPWARAYLLAQELPDVALFSTSRTTTRENLFHWVGPLFSLEWIFYARQDFEMELSSLEDAKQVKRIGTYRADAREQYLVREGFENLDTSNSMVQSFQKLRTGRVDLVASTNLTLPEGAEHPELAKSNFKPVLTFKSIGLYIAFSLETDPETVERWRAAFEELEAEGVLAEIRGRWLD